MFTGTNESLHSTFGAWSVIKQLINSMRAIINSSVSRRNQFERTKVWKSVCSLRIPVANLHVWCVTCNLFRKNIGKTILTKQIS